MTFHLHPKTRPGAVALTTQNLDRAINFYQQLIGLQLHSRQDGQATLSAGAHDLLYLHENPAARHYRGVTGLYHFAILLPNRRELARVLARLLQARYPNAPTDHVMTKTTYLSDPDGNGIELYCESPEDGEFVIEGGRFYARRADGSLSDGREALDVEALLTHLRPNDDLNTPMPPETRLGHVHLHVADLEAARMFYCDMLGFDDKGLMRIFRMGMVSVDGYHHHIGFNTWQGEGAPPPPQDATGLRWFSLHLPDEEALQTLRAHLEAVQTPYEMHTGGLWVNDPANNRILCRVKPTPKTSDP